MLSDSVRKSPTLCNTENKKKKTLSILNNFVAI